MLLFRNISTTWHICLHCKPFPVLCIDFVWQPNCLNKQQWSFRETRPSTNRYRTNCMAHASPFGNIMKQVLAPNNIRYIKVWFEKCVKVTLFVWGSPNYCIKALQRKVEYPKPKTDSPLLYQKHCSCAKKWHQLPAEDPFWDVSLSFAARSWELDHQRHFQNLLRNKCCLLLQITPNTNHVSNGCQVFFHHRIEWRNFCTIESDGMSRLNQIQVQILKPHYRLYMSSQSVYLP